jgi:hypothetical protein
MLCWVSHVKVVAPPLYSIAWTSLYCVFMTSTHAVFDVIALQLSAERLVLVTEGALPMLHFASGVPSRTHFMCMARL